MIQKSIFHLDAIPEALLSGLESRTTALWVRTLPKDSSTPEQLVAFLGLPWQLVLMESYDKEVVHALEKDVRADDPMVRKRGFPYVLDTDPSRIELPQRCLPIYLLNGRQAGPPAGDFQSQLRRMTMLEELRRSGVREILLLSGAEEDLPTGLADLWAAGFRSYLTIVSESDSAAGGIADLLNKTPSVIAANLIRLPTRQVVHDVVARYQATYPEDRHVLRIRDVYGALHQVDVTSCEEPERPIFAAYELIEERGLASLMPDELSEAEFVAFFRSSADSWRPYAAGLPWVRDAQCLQSLLGCMKRLDAAGSEANSIAYISCEPGAGGTTLARTLAWECAKLGYPVLLARQIPFAPDALPVINFLSRVHHATDVVMPAAIEGRPPQEEAAKSVGRGAEAARRYEAPWLIVFDTLHWQYRDDELLHFRREMEKAGRPVCVLVVAGPTVGLAYHNAALFKRLGTLTHALERDEAQQLGRHLNRFLKTYGKARAEWQWERFYEEHTIRYLDGIAAFWVTLSFWIQGQYDLSESIQEWMYRTFTEVIGDPFIRQAVLEIAALSSERLPMPEALLPASNGQWPVSALLDDSRASLGSLGLTRLTADGRKYWALVHDVLGRFLINALFYDGPTRDALGFSEARDAEHLRFLLLKRVANNPALGERGLRALGEDFATTILKIDPDHGHASFAVYWREVLDTLDNMPRSLRDNSRVFRHHTAVSRRRIAKLDDRLYGITPDDRIQLLRRAVDDIKYAITYIEYAPGSESTLNLLNSLANAYFDLAQAELVAGAPAERVAELRKLANDTTRRTFKENPTNSFVIETYVKSLLHSAREPAAHAAELCVEALGVLFSALSTEDVEYRNQQLQQLADDAMAILLEQAPAEAKDGEPRNALDVLIGAWRILAEGMKASSTSALGEVEQKSRAQALECLGHPAARGNTQVLRMRYDLLCIEEPNNFRIQLELIEQLQASDYKVSPQLRLEYALLLFQVGRYVEGEREFKELRQLWRKGEHFVFVPKRLRWLRATDGRGLQTLHAISGSDFGNRAMARVEEFGRSLVPFRPEEHGMQDVRPGLRFVCHASFGHNGPFLRPVTAKPQNSE